MTLDDLNNAFIITSGVLYLIVAITAILQTILFFKVWQMTNNVSKIQETMQEWFDLEHPIVEDEEKATHADTKAPK
jgi:hypothetical protein